MGLPKQREQVEKEVRELYGIKETDLETLPYKTLHWKCLQPMCNCGTTARDYGIAPYYYCPRKGWGWVEGTSWWMLCGKHWKHRDQILQSLDHRLNEQYFLSHFIKK